MDQRNSLRFNFPFFFFLSVGDSGLNLVKLAAMWENISSILKGLSQSYEVSEDKEVFFF